MITVKEIHNLKYYTGAAPQIQSLFSKGNRPREFGNKVWETSLILLDYFQKRPFDLQGLRVLEIGCGWGLLGVYLAKEFSCDVTCSDFDKNVLPVVGLIAELNGVKVKTKCASFSDLEESFLDNFDLIIGAEVCYSLEVAKDLTSLINRSFLTSVGEVLIADPGRPDFDECVYSCKENLKTEVINLKGSVNGKATKLLSVYR